MRTFRLATQSDLPELVKVTKSAFMDDERFKPLGATAGGPPGHDQIERHQEWLDTLLYYKCEENGSIVGVCTIEVNGNEAKIHGLNVVSDSIGKGIGSYMLRELQGRMLSVTKWTLITPDYATRNHHFYEKNGFVLKQKGDVKPDLGFGFYTYEKNALK
jgi:GNAT superfamily N-acetyltransferase